MYFVKLPQQIDMQFLVNHEAEFIFLGGCFGFQEGDRIGLIRNSQGNLHYYINGMDQGLAASNTPSPVWGVVDLYGMAVKVTILDRHDPSYPNNPPAPERRANSLFRHYPDLYDEEALEGVCLDFCMI